MATFGIPFDDHVDLAPNVGGWGDLPLGHELKAAFPGAAVRMATDAKAAALAEARWGALAGADPGIYLNLGTGLAVSIVVGGQVLQGRHGAAGEIGYNLRSVADVGAARPAAGARGNGQRPGPGPPRGHPGRRRTAPSPQAPLPSP